ncbi:hypothetical protein HC891_25065 [Candidatus Gracilibacteria bacterium]|nr:hypothetical protein [Candidatus Gracilibacteria bacterium]
MLWLSFLVLMLVVAAAPGIVMLLEHLMQRRSEGTEAQQEISGSPISLDCRHVCGTIAPLEYRSYVRFLPICFLPIGR